MLFFLQCCSKESNNIEIKSIDEFSVIVLEDCEYILKRHTGYKGLTHKGNCKNPIHNCNNLNKN